jgi:hypothetical protein
MGDHVGALARRDAELHLQHAVGRQPDGRNRRADLRGGTGDTGLDADREAARQVGRRGVGGDERTGECEPDHHETSKAYALMLHVGASIAATRIPAYRVGSVADARSRATCRRRGGTRATVRWCLREIRARRRLTVAVAGARGRLRALTGCAARPYRSSMRQLPIATLPQQPQDRRCDTPR